jgi:hypothetical protein
MFRAVANGTLFIRSSGVTLRGEGPGEDGTVLHATGATRRDVLVIRGDAGRLLLTTRTPVADLYVPAGAQAFHVEDAGAFRVGDAVVVRRTGNDRWIHHIAMDQILERPGGSPGETSQWDPFSLDFDRVITRIDGNVVTVDAPLGSAIERRWGGGAVLDNVRNGWVRDVTTLHLEHSLANVLRQAKWVTVQDSSAIDMVSLIGAHRPRPARSHEVRAVYDSIRHTSVNADVVAARGPS